MILGKVRKKLRNRRRKKKALGAIKGAASYVKDQAVGGVVQTGAVAGLGMLASKIRPRVGFSSPDSMAKFKRKHSRKTRKKISEGVRRSNALKDIESITKSGKNLSTISRNIASAERYRKLNKSQNLDNAYKTIRGGEGVMRILSGKPRTLWR